MVHLVGIGVPWVHLAYGSTCKIVHKWPDPAGVWGSNDRLMAVRVGGVQFYGLVHAVAEENEMEPSLRVRKARIQAEEMEMPYRILSDWETPHPLCITSLIPWHRNSTLYWDLQDNKAKCLVDSVESLIFYIWLEYIVKLNLSVSDRGKFWDATASKNDFERRMEWRIYLDSFSMW